MKCLVCGEQMILNPFMAASLSSRYRCRCGRTSWISNGSRKSSTLKLGAFNKLELTWNTSTETIQEKAARNLLMETYAEYIKWRLGGAVNEE